MVRFYEKIVWLQNVCVKWNKDHGKLMHHRPHIKCQFQVKQILASSYSSNEFPHLKCHLKLRRIQANTV